MRMLGIDASDLCRQYNRKSAYHYGKMPRYATAELITENALFESFGAKFAPIPRTIDRKSPVTSLDQLYAQVCPVFKSCTLIYMHMYVQLSAGVCRYLASKLIKITEMVCTYMCKPLLLQLAHVNAMVPSG